jgi:Cu(I)/Ag(I) efflux system membrane protein CusA/SilA
MIERIIEGSARNRFLIFLMAIFLSAAGLWSLKNIPLDAIPDLSDVQVIVYTPWMGRNPTIMEDQVTYPIVTTMISAPRVKFVRGFSDFGFSYVYIIFEDGTDIYWARSRVLEYLNQVSGRLPKGVTPTLGPDASGVGWVFQYALVDETGKCREPGRIRPPVPSQYRSQSFGCLQALTQDCGRGHPDEQQRSRRPLH